MKCLKCETGTILDRNKFIICDQNKRNDPASCNFILFKDSLAKRGLEKLSDDQLIELISGKTIGLTLVSLKTGKPFTCVGTMAEVDGRWKVQFTFPEKKSTSAPVKVFGETSEVKPVVSNSGSGSDYEEETFEDVV